MEVAIVFRAFVRSAVMIMRRRGPVRAAACRTSSCATVARQASPQLSATRPITGSTNGWWHRIHASKHSMQITPPWVAARRACSLDSVRARRAPVAVHPRSCPLVPAFSCEPSRSSPQWALLHDLCASNHTARLFSCLAAPPQPSAYKIRQLRPRKSIRRASCTQASCQGSP